MNAVETNYNRMTLTDGSVLTNKAGTRKIRIIRSFTRLTKTQCPTVYVYSVLDKNGNIDYNDQKTYKQMERLFPVKVA
jgi:hypothetical protein